MASLHKRSDTGTYYISYRVNGRQFKKGLGKVPKARALRALRKLEDDLDLRKLGLKLPQRITLKKFADAYLQWVEDNQAKNTLTSKKFSLKSFQNYLSTRSNYKEELFELHEITQELIENYKSYRIKSNVKHRTINIEIDCINNLLMRAKEWEYQTSSIKVKKLKETKKMPRFFSREEIQLLHLNASAYLNQIITVLLHTGMRIGELMSLKWEHIDFNKNIISILNTETFNTKNSKDRQIVINKTLQAHLLKHKEIYINRHSDKEKQRKDHQREFLICHDDGTQILKPSKAFRKLLGKLNIKGASLHTLRHTFASHLVMEGVDLPTIKEFLGHQNIQTTMIYAHLSNKHKQDAIEKLSDITNQPTNLTILKAV